MKFKHKMVTCKPEKVWKTRDRYRDLWIVALLTRMRVDPEKIDRIQNDPTYSKRAWRNELFFKHGIQVSKFPKKIEIRRFSESDDKFILLGVWKEPKIVRVKNNSTNVCQVHLDYWQLV
jgi:hypothetical protein